MSRQYVSYTHTLVAVQQGVDVEQCGHSHRTGDDALNCTWEPETPAAELRDRDDYWAIVAPHLVPYHRDPPTGCLVIIKSFYNECQHGLPYDEGCVHCVILETGDSE